MAKIDLYVRSMERFGARAVVLRSGANVTLRFPDGDRHATQTTTLRQLQEIVGEIASPDVRAAIATSGKASFDYSGDAGSFRVGVAVEGSAWSVTVEPAAAAAPAPTAAIPRPSPAPAMRQPAPPISAPTAMPIEPTSYGQVEVPPGDEDLPIERTQYEIGPSVSVSAAAPAQVGDKLVDKLLFAAKDCGASDLHLFNRLPADGPPPR